jgi:hypothetical protein
MLAFRSVQQHNHCARDDFLYELKAGNDTTVTGVPTHPPTTGEPKQSRTRPVLSAGTTASP